jgi:N-dimethylarginine dimethylaminohydrolase
MSAMATCYGRVLMCPPTYFTVRDTKNPFMNPDEPPDRALARRQWEDVRAAFERAGAQTVLVDPVEDLEDMVFAANQAFVGHGTAHERFAVPSTMRYASRRREVPFFAARLQELGFELIDLGLVAANGEFVEGHGDLLAHPGSPHVWAGYGIRSSRSGVMRFAAAVKSEGIDVTPLELVDETFYHLDTCFTPLGAEAALVYPGALSEASFRLLRRAWPRLRSVSREDAARFVCNGVAVNGRFIVSYLPDNVAEFVRNEGLTPVVVGMSEFEKAGGSVFCLKMFLD